MAFWASNTQEVTNGCMKSTKIRFNFNTNNALKKCQEPAPPYKHLKVKHSHSQCWHSQYIRTEHSQRIISWVKLSRINIQRLMGKTKTTSKQWFHRRMIVKEEIKVYISQRLDKGTKSLKDLLWWTLMTINWIITLAKIKKKVKYKN